MLVIHYDEGKDVLLTLSYRETHVIKKIDYLYQGISPY